MKNWGLLLSKGIVFVLLFCLVDFGMGRLFVIAKNKSLERHPGDMWLKSSYTVEKVKTDCIIIGSSTAEHHYIPDVIENKTGLSTYNCGQDGCFFLYSCCLVNTLIERYSPKIIIIDINPRSLLDTDKGDEYQNMRYLSFYYDKDSVVRNFIDSKSEKNRLLYHLNSWRYNSHFVYAFYPIIHESPTQQGYIPLSPKKGYTSKKNPMHWEGNWVNSELSELYKTINNCKERGVELIIVTSPYCAKCDNSVKEKCDEFAELLSDKGVKYINLLDVAPFNTDSSLFKGASHLNAKGAAIMSDSIANILLSMSCNDIPDAAYH